jgi:hypothetical protein
MGSRKLFSLLSFVLTLLSATLLKAETQALPVLDDDSILSYEDFRSNEIYNYNFGYWPVGMTAYKDLYFANNGNWPLEIEGIYVWGLSYFAVHRCPPKLRAGYRCLVRTLFLPWSAGYHDGQLLINTDRGRLHVYLAGWGY